MKIVELFIQRTLRVNFPDVKKDDIVHFYSVALYKRTKVTFKAYEVQSS